MDLSNNRVVGNVIGAGAMLLLLAGCVTTTQTTGPRPTATVSKPPPPFAGNAMEALDPCGDRIQDLCGPLILYYQLHHRGPEHIEELQAFADPGQTLKLTCPVSGKPYLCAPSGLQAPGQNRRIYIYDADPVHGGARCCAVTKQGVTAGADAAFFEDKIPEAEFRLFTAVGDR